MPTFREDVKIGSKVPMMKTDDYNDQSVTEEKLKDGAITNEKMAAGSVGNTNLQDGSVSNEKLEDGSITNEKLAENSITKDKLKDNTIGVEKLDPQLRQTINAATGLPEDLVETIQNVDDTLKDHQSQLNDKQSQIDDKQQQITDNDDDILLLQIRSTQMEQSINNIAVTGGASVANTVAYSNTASGLVSINAQGAIDELAAKNATKAEKAEVTAELEKKFDKESISQESGDAEDKVMSQKAVSTKFSEISEKTYNILKENIADEDEEIIIGESEEDYIVKINKDGADFKSLKNNGKPILDKSNVVQELGESVDNVVSQKTISDEINPLKAKTSNMESSSTTSEDETIIIGESEEDYIVKINKDGADFKSLKNNGKPILDKSNVVQELGESVDNVVSQKTISDEINPLKAKTSNMESSSTTSEDETIIIGESEEDYVAKINMEGLYANGFYRKTSNGKYELIDTHKLTGKKVVGIGDSLSQSGYYEKDFCDISGAEYVGEIGRAHV